MNLHQFLTDPAIQLPIRRDTDDFQAFVEGILDVYLDRLGQLTQPTDVIAEIKAQKANVETFCRFAKEVIRATFAGHPHDAYQAYLEAVKPITAFIHAQALQIGTGDLKILYRVRRQLTASLSREDLFHIPFEKRHLVSTQRYSIPGLPCLYLGGSLYTCWAEMGRPPFHELHAAAFWLQEGKSVKILNFSDRPARLLLYVNPEGGIPNEPQIRALIVNHIVLWPLMAMCSIVVKHRDAPYKPEYIFPQTVLQWVTKEHEFDGICYFSTHVEAVTNHPLPPCNLVFPARVIKPKGRCDRLRSLFKMAAPHGWELLRAVQVGEGMPGFAVPNFDFVFVDGRKEPYYKTEFGNVQSKLNKMAHDTMFRNTRGEPDLGDVKA
jgi:hypothetical protein